jgi:Flp pilus assembly protein TadD
VSSFDRKERTMWSRNVRNKTWITLATVALLAWTPGVTAEMPATPPLRWHTKLPDALREASADGKPVLVMFSAPWCGYCKKMEREVLPDAEVINYLKGYILAYINIDENDSLSTQYQIKGVPSFVIMDGKGNAKRKIEGFHAVRSFVSELETYQKMRAEVSEAKQLLNRARELLNQNDYKGARKELERLVTICPDYGRSHFYLGFTLLQLGENSDAERCFRKAIQLDPNEAVARHYLGLLLFKAERYSEAEKELREASRLDPKDARTQDLLASALVWQGKRDEAEKACREAIRLSPTDASLCGRCGWTMVAAENNPVAEEMFRKAVDMDQKGHNAWYGLAGALYAQQKYPEAEKAYRQALALAPDDAGVLNDLGYMLAEVERFEEAEPLCKKAVALMASPNNLDSLAFALAGLGRYEEAESVYRKALEQKPDHACVRGGLGFVLWRKGKTEEGERECREALKSDPEDHLALKNLAAILDSKGASAEARTYWERALKVEKRPLWIERIKKRLGETKNPEVPYAVTVPLMGGAGAQETAGQTKAATPPQNPIKFCTECGSKLPNGNGRDVKFCPYCGTKLTK